MCVYCYVYKVNKSRVGNNCFFITKHLRLSTILFILSTTIYMYTCIHAYTCLRKITTNENTFGCLINPHHNPTGKDMKIPGRKQHQYSFCYQKRKDETSGGLSSTELLCNILFRCEWIRAKTRKGIYFLVHEPISMWRNIYIGANNMCCQGLIN